MLFYCRCLFDAHCLHTICLNVRHSVSDSDNRARVISGFLRGVNKIFAFLKYYAAYNGSYLGDPGVDGRIIFRWTFRK